MTYTTKKKKPYYSTEPFGMPFELSNKKEFKKLDPKAQKEIWEAYRKLNKKQYKAYSDFRYEGLEHKTSLKLAEKK